MDILILDDHKIFVESIKKLLEELDEINSLDISNNYTEFIELFERKTYNLVLLDIHLKNQNRDNGLDISKELLVKYPELKIMILTSYDLPLYEERAKKTGVKGFLNKSIDKQGLITALLKVDNDKTIFSQSFNNIDELTEREVEVLRGLTKGSNRKELAQELYVSERTLYNHIQSIYEKLQVKNEIEAMNKAIEAGYIDPIV